jgi:predicted 2-oxoglutarate/Fe(II)-dependent dioxygenase YbiX
MSKVSVLDKDIFTITEIFTEEECRDLIARGESLGFEAATVQLSSGPQMMTHIRNNDRVTFDDTVFAEEIWQRVAQYVPTEIDGWTAVRLNERFRFYRYDPEQRFKRHKDGIVVLPSGEESRLSFLIYLNEGYDGGETTFSDYRFENGTTITDTIKVSPQTGMGLFFIHQRWHEGAPVNRGRKYLLRTDVIYKQL